MSGSGAIKRKQVMLEAIAEHHCEHRNIYVGAVIQNAQTEAMINYHEQRKDIAREGLK